MKYYLFWVAAVILGFSLPAILDHLSSILDRGGTTRTNMRFHFHFLAPLALIAVTTAAAPLYGQSQSALIDGAKKEGKLTWYTSMAVDTSKPVLDAFVKEYPFIKPELVRLGEEQLVNRILSETRAGRWAFDVLSTSSIATMIERKMITPYLAPDRDLFMDQFKDPQGYWTGVFVNNLVLAFNTKMLAAKDAPKSYEDLLQPRWKGQMLMDSTDYDWFGTLMTVWGREKTVKYMQQLAKQDPLWRRGHGLTAQLVGAGEVPLAWAYNFRIERMKSDGAPVDWIESFDPDRGDHQRHRAQRQGSQPQWRQAADQLRDFA